MSHHQPKPTWWKQRMTFIFQALNLFVCITNPFPNTGFSTVLASRRPKHCWVAWRQRKGRPTEAKEKRRVRRESRRMKTRPPERRLSDRGDHGLLRVGVGDVSQIKKMGWSIFVFVNLLMYTLYIHTNGIYPSTYRSIHLAIWIYLNLNLFEIFQIYCYLLLSIAIYLI